MGKPIGSSGPELCGIPNASVFVLPGAIDTALGLAHLEVDDHALFVGTLTDVYSVPLSGGNLEGVYETPVFTEGLNAFWLRGDNILAWRLNLLDVQPMGGGGLAQSYKLSTFYSRAALSSDGKTFYGVDDSETDNAYTRVVTAHHLDAGTKTTLQSKGSSGFGHAFEIVGDYMYMSDAGNKENEFDLDDPSADHLYRLPLAGGAAEEVPIDGAFEIEIIGSRDGDLFFIGGTRPLRDADDTADIYRLSTAGGKPELVVDASKGNHDTASLGYGFTALSDHSIICSGGKCYSIPKTGEGTQILASDCIAGSSAATEDAVFLVTDAPNDQIQVLRVPLK
jgi:hypothetical protein